ncbi:Hypothetical protein DPCES_0960 [Desulfitobacterium hafniense]|uniref:Uncharacterized protein n=1 Tax=Desulfitobacterium hafniense TaxID=49338 RepID=A0A098AXL1_DESHA|nr:hypothetical protein [Desulfitobacterium hafniense]CDX00847.1 Hypothetical protein DPCES_0960 [Desulfitobacterium hafniense]
MTIFYKWLLFISSYTPLYVLLAIDNYNFKCTPIAYFKGVLDDTSLLVFWIVIITLFVISILSVSYFVFISLNDTRVAEDVKPINESVLSYLITYVIPLINMNVNSVNSLLVNLLLFLVIGVVYVKSDLIYLNILLILLGFRVYNDPRGNVIITNYSRDELISSVNTMELLSYRNVVKGVYLVRRKKEKNKKQ